MSRSRGFLGRVNERYQGILRFFGALFVFVLVLGLSAVKPLGAFAAAGDTDASCGATVTTKDSATDVYKDAMFTTTDSGKTKNVELNPLGYMRNQLKAGKNPVGTDLVVSDTAKAAGLEAYAFPENTATQAWGFGILYTAMPAYGETKTWEDGGNALGSMYLRHVGYAKDGTRLTLKVDVTRVEVTNHNENGALVVGKGKTATSKNPDHLGEISEVTAGEQLKYLSFFGHADNMQDVTSLKLMISGVSEDGDTTASNLSEQASVNFDYTVTVIDDAGNVVPFGARDTGEETLDNLVWHTDDLDMKDAWAADAGLTGYDPASNTKGVNFGEGFDGNYVIQSSTSGGTLQQTCSDGKARFTGTAGAEGNDTNVAQVNARQTVPSASATWTAANGNRLMTPLRFYMEQFPGLSVDKTIIEDDTADIADGAEAGDTVEWYITVKNKGSVPAKTVTINDTLGNGGKVTIVGVEGTYNTYDEYE